MSIRVALHHVTHYRYDRLVALSPQVVRLRPAPHCRTPILSYSMRVEPAEHFINWQQDAFANYQARLVFPEKTREFKVTVDLVAEMEQASFRMLVIVSVDLEASGLAFDAPLCVFEFRHDGFRLAVRGHQRIALLVACGRKRRGLLRGNAKLIGTVPQSRDSYGRMDTVFGWHVQLLSVRC